MPAEHRQTRSRTLRSTVPLAVALAAPWVAVPLVGRALADQWASQAGPALAQIASSNREAHAAEMTDTYQGLGIGDGVRLPLPYYDDDARTAGTVVPPVPAQHPPSTATPRRHARSAQPPRSTPHRGIFVRAELVSRAVERGTRPSGSAVAASGSRPAGMALLGVSGFGVGLRDGDVLTSVGGTPATSESAVVAAVSGAVRSGAKAIGGVIWRGDQPIPVTVQIPARRGRSGTHKRRHR